MEEKRTACRDLTFGGNQVSDALVARLAELGASAPWFVDRKELFSSDVRSDQNRLQISSKSPISQVFTDAEKAGVRTGKGLPVTAFDRRGQQYELTCKLSSKKIYRLMGDGWARFLTDHKLRIAREAWIERHVVVELWAFRSRALRRGDDGEGEGDDDPGHPDGALGLVVLHRDKGEGGEQEAEVVVEAPVRPAGEEAEMRERAVVQREAAAGARVEQGQGEAGAEAAVAKVQEETPSEQGKKAGYHIDEDLPPWLFGTILLVLRTSNRTKRKRNDVAR